MKVLMISIDKGLLGKGQLGDVIERHKKYGEFVDCLDIIVFSKTSFKENKISEKVTAYPTNSLGKLNYFFDGKKIAKKLFAKNHYDLIVTQEPFLTGRLGVVLKKKFKSKLLVHLHGDFKGLLLSLAKLFVLSKADAIRVMSQGQKDRLKFAGINEEKINVISTPIDLKKFEAVSNNSTIEKEEKTILHIGRSDKVKDYDTLIKALARVNLTINGVKFLQFGGREEFNLALQRQKSAHIDGLDDLKFKSEAVIQQKELLLNYTKASVVVLSSKSESFGKVLIEANACGKPVVSTATTGAKEIIKDGVNGYLVPIGDDKAMAEKIIYLLQNPDEARKMGERGKKLVLEKYSDNTQKIINLWKSITRS